MVSADNEATTARKYEVMTEKFPAFAAGGAISWYSAITTPSASRVEDDRIIRTVRFSLFF